MVDNTKEKDPKDDFEFEVEKPEIEIEDDTPQEDRGKTPMPKALVDELEADELEEYSDKVKTRLKQMKKVWHDERREKEIALREHQEAISLATRVLDENRRLLVPIRALPSWRWPQPKSLIRKPMSPGTQTRLSKLRRR